MQGAFRKPFAVPFGTTGIRRHEEWQFRAIGPSSRPFVVGSPPFAHSANTRAWAARRTSRGVCDFAEIM
jgi:hypothetical protein